MTSSSTGAMSGANPRMTSSRASNARASSAAPWSATAASRPSTPQPISRGALVLALAVALGHHGDRARRAVQEPLAGAARQHAPGAPDVRRADHDQRGVIELRELVQRACRRRAGDRANGGVEPVAVSHRLEQRLGILAQRLAVRDAGRATADVLVCERVRQREACAGERGETTTEGHGVLAALGSVDSDDDLRHDLLLRFRWMGHLSRATRSTRSSGATTPCGGLPATRETSRCDTPGTRSASSASRAVAPGSMKVAGSVIAWPA